MKTLALLCLGAAVAFTYSACDDDDHDHDHHHGQHPVTTTTTTEETTVHQVPSRVTTETQTIRSN